MRHGSTRSIRSFIGGITQSGELAGNVCADLNGMGGGAPRSQRDGEASMAPFFAAMADIGEQEIIEDDVPLTAAHLEEDQALTIRRSASAVAASGYEMVAHAPRQPVAGASPRCSHGSKFPSVPRLCSASYGCCAYPLGEDQP